MKIGILTFVHTSNYGAVWQAYAMQTLLSRLGVESTFLDYYAPAVLKNHDPRRLIHRPGWGNKLIWPFAYAVYRKRLERFLDFERRFLTFSDRKYDRDTVALSAGEYDRFVVGSDQVWNPIVTGGDFSYFLDFLPEKEKKIAFAASAGAGDFPEPFRDTCTALVRDFACVNVRESSLAQTLIAAGIAAYPVPDPTLMLVKEDWMGFVGPRPRKKPYVLVYMPPSDDSVRRIKAYARRRGMDVFLVKKGVKPTPGVKTLNTLSPTDFLTWLYHADTVMSGSFHGVCFSVLLEKPFWAFPSRLEERTGRTDDLLAALQLTHRKVGEGTDFSAAMDWADAQQRLLAMREAAADRLKQGLQIG